MVLWVCRSLVAACFLEVCNEMKVDVCHCELPDMIPGAVIKPLKNVMLYGQGAINMKAQAGCIIQEAHDQATAEHSIRPQWELP